MATRTIALFVAIATAGIAGCLVAWIVNSGESIRSGLVSSTVRYFYVPSAAVRHQKLPFRLTPPKANRKRNVGHALMFAHLTSLEGNGTATNGTNGTAKFSCKLPDLKTEASKVYATWNKCVTRKGYKKPNADAKRRYSVVLWLLVLRTYNWHRLLSLEEGHTHSLDWGWIQAKSSKDFSGLGLSSQMLEEAKEDPGVVDCEVKAASSVCSGMAKCKEPVCTSYYVDEDVQRLCGICLMMYGQSSCFAATAPVLVEGRGVVPLGSVSVGERVAGAGADG
eukprot:CAMPEP_0113706312 /NCGR_PEP_ID=MMETSP0038_2-20120614/27647_1 /TAXON_ID=2898 /ORGANISM="Cryptomonas paramecium" /LENGTH=278 /DNA_ID=CAMNT_0000631475 /DNA_START=1 /DNA_END=835 /DNA_ORIENTATION=- /assembly_acc=CAM_ASM_000170